MTRVSSGPRTLDPTYPQSGVRRTATPARAVVAIERVAPVWAMVRPGIRGTPPTRSGPHQRRTGVRDDRCALGAGRGWGRCTLGKEALNGCDKPYPAACWRGGAHAG